MGPYKILFLNDCMAQLKEGQLISLLVCFVCFPHLVIITRKMIISSRFLAFLIIFQSFNLVNAYEECRVFG